MQEITQELVRELFKYHDGFLYWKVHKNNHKAKVGDQAGSKRKDGYYRIQINGDRYLTHRLIFIYHHGFIPKQIDHIDRNPSNNRIENLRETTPLLNVMNRNPDKNSSSKYKGVSLIKRDKMWLARIHINGKNKHLGIFKLELDAAIAYNTAAIKYYGKENVYLNEV